MPVLITGTPEQNFDKLVDMFFDVVSEHRLYEKKNNENAGRRCRKYLLQLGKQTKVVRDDLRHCNRVPIKPLDKHS